MKYKNLNDWYYWLFLIILIGMSVIFIAFKIGNFKVMGLQIVYSIVLIVAMLIIKFKK